MLEKGGIYLASLYPSKGAEPGKVRPVLIMQSNTLNEIEHSTVVILPITSKLIDDTFPLRFRLQPRDKLNQESDVLCDQIRVIDMKRITSEKLAMLSIEEIVQVEQQIKMVLDMMD
ncbi:MAG: type II toxin-antitoxin system PemK/MazF family toxin [Campylobacterota bacterium]|nr:type II toxin-antitoxin system PemK/MazF family toxin [Campylobacterota bacterium]